MGALEGKVAVIAGGTSGIGARAAELFVSEGAVVVVGGRREPEGKGLVMKLGPRARFVPADVAVESDVENLVGDAVAHFGRLDVVINNAGIGGSPPGGLDTIDLRRFWAIVAVHVGGVLAGMKYAARVMLEQGSGSIVNTASTGGRLGDWTGTDYSAAKAAVLQLTRCAAVELGEHGIRVNSVSPGPVATGIFGKAAGMDPAALTARRSSSNRRSSPRWRATSRSGGRERPATSHRRCCGSPVTRRRSSMVRTSPSTAALPPAGRSRCHVRSARSLRRRSLL
jgi:NAD(P)-dependent dehydrogenase (short-subunit alcohol dehydrogenase family)